MSNDDGGNNVVHLPFRLAVKTVRNEATGCLVWTGRTNRGYARASIDGRETYIHRWWWEQVNGPVPAGLELRHTCDNPPCIEPTHMVVGTHVDNMADMVARGRGNNANRGKTHCKRDHEFTPENTYVPPGTNKRECRTCIRTNAQKRRQR